MEIPTKHLRVVSLTTTNYKRIKAARIDPPPGENVILIGGEIDNGKSSFLDSMLDAIAGREFSPEKPVRSGMKKGSVVMDLGDLVVSLRLTSAGGRELIVEDKDGNRLKSPQAVMDSLTGKVGFDAEAFLRFKPDVQLATLRKIVGIDFAPLDAKKADLYSKRTAANSVVKTLEAQVTESETGTPAELVDVTALLAEIKKIEEYNKGRQPLVDKFTEAKISHAEAGNKATTALRRREEALAKLEAMKLALAKAEDELAAATTDLTLANTEVNNAMHVLTAAREAGQAFQVKDASELTAKVASAETLNGKFRRAEARKKLLADIRDAQAKATALDNAVQEIDGQKEKMLLEAKFPVKGLGFTESGITFDGLPFDQAASSTKRRVSVAIGAALNPTLRVMVIKDGSLLGTKGIDQVRELANEFDLQVWIEVVTSDEEDRKRCTVVIEDGAIAGAPPPIEEPAADSPPQTPGVGVGNGLGASTASIQGKEATPPDNLFGDLPPQ